MADRYVIVDGPDPDILDLIGIRKSQEQAEQIASDMTEATGRTHTVHVLTPARPPAGWAVIGDNDLEVGEIAEIHRSEAEALRAVDEINGASTELELDHYGTVRAYALTLVEA